MFFCLKATGYFLESHRGINNNESLRGITMLQSGTPVTESPVLKQTAWHGHDSFNADAPSQASSDQSSLVASIAQSQFSQDRSRSSNSTALKSECPLSNRKWFAVPVIFLEFLKPKDRVALSLSSWVGNCKFREYQMTRKSMFFHQISNELLQKIAKFATQLNVLEITDCSKLSDFAPLTTLTHLHALRLSDPTPHKNPKVFSCIGSSCQTLAKLETLCLGFIKITCTDFRLLSVLTTLRNLELLGITIVTRKGKDKWEYEPLDMHLNQLTTLTGLQTLNLSGNEIHAGLASLAGLTGVQTLILNQTRITDNDVPPLSSFGELQKLDLRYAYITETGLKVLSILTKVDTLFLAEVKITDSGLTTVAANTNLTHLTLSRTRITSIGLQALSLCTKLQNLSVSYCGITDRDFVHLPPHPSLQILDLGGNIITDISVTHLTLFISVHTLSLADAKITNVEPLTLLTNLRELNLSYTKIPDAGSTPLSLFTRLQILDLDYANLPNEMLEQLSHLTCLQELHMAGDEMTDAKLRHLRLPASLHTLMIRFSLIREYGLTKLHLPVNLHTLSFSSTNIGDKGLKHICLLSNLHTLDLSSTLITEAGLLCLTALKKLRILNVNGTSINKSNGGVGIMSYEDLLDLVRSC